MFALYDTVLIKSKNIPGTIIDIVTSDGKKTYTVESNVKGRRTDGYGGVWPLFCCAENELQSYKER